MEPPSVTVGVDGERRVQARRIVAPASTDIDIHARRHAQLHLCLRHNDAVDRTAGGFRHRDGNITTCDADIPIDLDAPAGQRHCTVVRQRHRRIDTNAAGGIDHKLADIAVPQHVGAQHVGCSIGQCLAARRIGTAILVTTENEFRLAQGGTQIERELPPNGR